MLKIQRGGVHAGERGSQQCPESVTSWPLCGGKTVLYHLDERGNSFIYSSGGELLSTEEGKMYLNMGNKLTKIDENGNAVAEIRLKTASGLP